MPSWADGDEEGRLAEWAGVGRHKLAQAPRGAQCGASLPRVIEGHPDRLHCKWCGRDEPWPEWWDKGGADGPPRCPGCGEA